MPINPDSESRLVLANRDEQVVNVRHDATGFPLILFDWRDWRDKSRVQLRASLALSPDVRKTPLVLLTAQALDGVNYTIPSRPGEGEINISVVERQLKSNLLARFPNSYQATQKELKQMGYASSCWPISIGTNPQIVVMPLAEFQKCVPDSKFPFHVNYPEVFAQLQIAELAKLRAQEVIIESKSQTRTAFDIMQSYADAQLFWALYFILVINTKAEAEQALQRKIGNSKFHPDFELLECI
ncbi:hypothetical protein KA082_01340 [Candidatus Woesebacteria bacterium]|nr:hypothetical protein [Candidatus Woesebacteria bacterium]